MSQIRFFTDEDIYAAVAVALRRHGIDVISTPEVGRLGETDESQLLFATNQQRAILTFNVADFAILHAQWLQQGKHHAGIVISQQRQVGDLVRRIVNLATTLDAASIVDRLEFVGDW